MQQGGYVESMASIFSDIIVIDGREKSGKRQRYKPKRRDA